MTLKSPLWQPIAIVLSAANLVAVGFASAAAEPWHAGAHAALALGFGLWAQRLKRTPSGGASGDLLERIELLEGEMGGLRQELSEAQERLDFTERMLAQAPETRPGRPRTLARSPQPT